MKNHKHSSGPWKAINMDGKYFPSVLIGPPRRYSDNSGVGVHKIVVNEGQPPDEDYWSNTMETCQANASLISASPDMYEALEAIEQVFEVNGEGIFQREERQVST